MPNKFDGFFINGIETNKVFSNFNKKIAAITNPAVIAAIPVIKSVTEQKINEITKPISQFFKTFEPEIINVLNIANRTYNYFEKFLRNEYDLRNGIKTKWHNLENELKYKNRSFPNSDFISLFEVCVKEANYTLDVGYIFYRARKIDINDLSEDVNNLITKLNEKYEEYDYQKQSNKEKNIFDYLYSQPIEEWEQDYINELGINNIVFWGYDAENSDAPPNEKSISGRINPSGISCLYAADEPMTAISEIQPTIDQIVSVAEIEIKRKLCLFNFNFYEAFNGTDFLEKSLTEIEEEFKVPFENIRLLFETVSELFSRPSLGNTENYYVTQYLSDFIKSKGFDGLVYNSSLKENGKNIVLFDTSKDDTGSPNNYTIKNSKLVKIDKVEIQYKKLLPKENKSDNV